jgi:hypothetical protein
VQKSCVWQKGKIFLQKNKIFRDFCKNLANNRFSEKNLWELLDARVLHSFSTLIRDGAVFLEVRSNKIETVQYFKAKPKSHDAK